MTFSKFQKGFSLIEVVLVVALAGLIILTVGNLPSSIKLIGNSRNESLAKEIAQKKIEQLRNQTYTYLADGTTPLTDTRLSSLPEGSGEVVIGSCPANICTNQEAVKEVKVTVSWKDAKNTQSVVLTTLISEGGLQ